MANSYTTREPLTLIFIVGIGAPANIYTHLVKCLQEQIPHTACHILEWWTQDDFGKNSLKNYIKNSNTILIGHSAGGSRAIDALAQWPDLVNKVIMLDSHRLQSLKPFPPVEKMLEIMLSQDSPEIKSEVTRAYTPILKNSTTFYKAVDFIVKWVADDFDKVAAVIKSIPPHSVLHVGFTDNNYQILDTEHEKDQHELWGKYNIGIEFLPMTHFDLLDSDHAKDITQLIVNWLQRFNGA